MNSTAYVWMLSAGIFCTSSAVADERAPQASPASAAAAEVEEQFDMWLVELDDRLFATREGATHALREAGRPAIPYLEKAVHGDSLEAADRAVWILQQFAASGDQDLQLDALAVLVEAKRFPGVSRKADESLGQIYQQICQAHFEELGAEFTIRTDRQTRFGDGVAIVVNTKREEWHGEPDDLLALEKLRRLSELKITAPMLENQHLERIVSIQGLTFVELVETRVTYEMVEKLRQQQPELRVVLRSKAGLGVGFGQGGSLVVTQVIPGKPAERAGMEVGDVVHEFNGHRVDNFDELTARIAQHAPGESVQITVLRGEEQVTLTAVLESADWSANTRSP